MKSCSVYIPLLASVFLPSFARADFATGLTAYWRFDETSGTTASSSVGTYDATLRPNASFVNDAQRNQVVSTGTGNALSYDDAVPFLSTSAGTILGWVKMGDTDGTKFMFETVDYSVGSEPRLYVFNSNGAFRVGIGTTSSYSTSVTNISTNTWHQVALTWQEGTPGSGSGDVTAFFDGLPVFGTTYNGFTSLGLYFAMGSQFYPSPGGGVVGSQLNGFMDEVGIWNRELGQQEVLDIFNQGYILAPVPEPSGLALGVTGLTAMCSMRRRRSAWQVC